MTDRTPTRFPPLPDVPPEAWEERMNDWPDRTPTTAAGRRLVADATDHPIWASAMLGYILAIEAEARAPLDVLNARIAWEDVLDGLEVALSYPAEMEVNRERWRAARINLLAALAALEEPTP